MRFTSLITVKQLLANSAKPSWVLIDCRYDLGDLQAGRVAFAAGHLPGAHYADLERDLSGEKFNVDGKFCGRHPLPERAQLVETLRAFGINSSSQVIAYDAHGGMFAARLWWLLRWVGHAAVAVLDGGIDAWRAAGLPLFTESALRPRGDICQRESLATTVNVDEVLANLQSGKRLVIDARAPDRFRGDNETIDTVAGHIPGAKNRFFKHNLQADGRFKTAEQLRAEFGALMPNSAAGIMQCGSGVSACHHLLALEIAGLSGAALYPGSWSEWCADRSRPVATGE